MAYNNSTDVQYSETFDILIKITFGALIFFTFIEIIAFYVMKAQGNNPEIEKKTGKAKVSAFTAQRIGFVSVLLTATAITVGFLAFEE